MRRGFGMEEKGMTRDKRQRLPRRRQKVWIRLATALVGVFLLQIGTYFAINNSQWHPQGCGNDCPRPHLPLPNQYNNEKNITKSPVVRQAIQHSKNSDSDSKSMLIVGGSDGSGTRAIVEILRGLGTIVVSEDLGTFDVSAEEIFHSMPGGRVSRGWPSLVERFASNFGREGFFQSSTRNDENDTPSVNYCWPPPSKALETEMDVAERIEADVTTLLTHWRDMYEQSTKNNISKIHFSTRDVTYAIKAPASMLVLPVFAYMQLQQKKNESQPKQRLKFLHVIRDGRDVALSDNQSPVLKFYNLTYPPDHPRRQSIASFVSSSIDPNDNAITHAKAIQLWNDWNINTYRWANDPKHSGVDIDYMWIRSEDLLVPGSPERFDALTTLAGFVGSNITPSELCALSNRGTIDYGQSMRSVSHSIFRNRAGGGEIDILSKWESQNRDAEKRKRLQHQSGRRRLLEDKQISEFSVIHHDLSPSVRNRYGKWKSLLKKKPRLQEFFYQEGREGLSLFGYHPYRKINYTDVDLSSDLCGH